MCNSKNHSPQCTCGFGGIGHKGVNPGGYSIVHLNPSRITSHVEKLKYLYSFRESFSYTNPNAKCPICNALVFFYQNDYGSKVYFDSLGKPWPKHSCFENKLVTPLIVTKSEIAAFSNKNKATIIPVKVFSTISVSIDFYLLKLEINEIFYDVLLNKNQEKFMKGLTVLSKINEKNIIIECFNIQTGTCMLTTIRKEEAIKKGFENYFTLDIGDILDIEILTTEEIGAKFRIKVKNSNMKVKHNLFIRNANLKNSTKDKLKNSPENILIKAKAFKIIDRDMMFEEI